MKKKNPFYHMTYKAVLLGNLTDYCYSDEDWIGDIGEEQYEQLCAHIGKQANLTVECNVGGNLNFEDHYYNARFQDGFEAVCISGLHFRLITPERPASDIYSRPQTTPDLFS